MSPNYGVSLSFSDTRPIESFAGELSLKLFNEYQNRRVLDLVNSRGNYRPEWDLVRPGQAVSLIGKIRPTSPRSFCEYTSSIDYVVTGEISSHERLRVIIPEAPRFIRESSKEVEGTNKALLLAVYSVRFNEQSGTPAKIKYFMTSKILTPRSEAWE